MNPNLPEIRTEINKEPEEKKRGGFFANLFGGGGSASGGLGGWGGAATSGGLLATKTGLLAVLLVGTTVAGGVGMVGMRLFGGGADSDPGAGSLSVFAPRPQGEGSGSSADGQKSADGNSASLQYLAQANAPAPAAQTAAAPAGAAAAAGAADAVKDAAAAAKGVGNENHGAGAVGKMPAAGALKPKFGELSKGGGGGASGASASASAGRSAAESGSGSSTGGFNAGRGGARASNSTGRSIARAGSRGAMKQAMDSLTHSKGATSSYGAGRTFDGSAPNSAISGEPGGTGIGMAGPGLGSDTAPQPTSRPNSALDKKETEAPPTPKSVEVTPWKNTIQMAQVLLGIAALMLLVADKIPKAYNAAFCALIMVLGGMVVALGAQIAGGAYGQKLQGGILAAAGAGIIAGAAWAMAASGSANTEAAKANQIGGYNPWVVLGGGAALIGIAGSMIMPPKKYPSTEFEEGRPPDGRFFGMREAPSEKALARYLA